MISEFENIKVGDYIVCSQYNTKWMLAIIEVTKEYFTDSGKITWNKKSGLKKGYIKWDTVSCRMATFEDIEYFRVINSIKKSSSIFMELLKNIEERKLELNKDSISRITDITDKIKLFKQDFIKDEIQNNKA